MVWLRVSLFCALVGCDNTESPACPEAIVRTVSEADAPEAYDAAQSARAESTLFDTLDPAQADIAIALEVVSLDEVERVDRSPACADDVGHRARAQIEIYAPDGSLSVRGPGLVSLPTHGSAGVSVTTASLIIDETTVVTDFDRPDGVALGGIDLEVDADIVTLLRIDMASDCTSIEDCDAVERIPVASWQQPPLDFDLWFEGLGP